MHTPVHLYACAQHAVVQHHKALGCGEEGNNRPECPCAWQLHRPVTVAHCAEPSPLRRGRHGGQTPFTRALPPRLLASNVAAATFQNGKRCAKSSAAASSGEREWLLAALPLLSTTCGGACTLLRLISWIQRPLPLNQRHGVINWCGGCMASPRPAMAMEAPRLAAAMAKQHVQPLVLE